MPKPGACGCFQAPAYMYLAVWLHGADVLSGFDNFKIYIARRLV